ncbi:Bgt-50822 [Blumeria graminis f. sp. tritici]|uniref:Bgt-50822 n=1 Tax=Blumeria graminis f. sp. tritici TaxID=62690 RepID=A0A9X9MJK4_BLUGR|nr:Bgt-50822 [Blumeria graminis f. sp. tritici]
MNLHLNSPSHLKSLLFLPKKRKALSCRANIVAQNLLAR